ncbi:hypothetical protein pb186bvf_002475 [Paramecium bursaria]
MYISRNSLKKVGMLTIAGLMGYQYQTLQSQDTFKNIYEKSKQSIVVIKMNDQVVGQGVILPKKIGVTFGDYTNKQVQGFVNGERINLQNTNQDENLQFFKVDDGKHKPLEYFAQPQKGQSVYVLGYNNGVSDFKKCYISDTFQTIDGSNIELLNGNHQFFVMQNCSSLQGSPVFNKSGYLLGILSENKNGVQKAISSEVFQKVDPNNLKRSYLGCTFKTSEQGGAFVIKINTDSPADKGGLKLGDVIKQINGTPIKHGTDVFKMLGYSKLQTLRFQIDRDGKEKQLDINLY